METGNDRTQITDWNSPDWLLQEVVRLANRGIELGVTLLAGGTLVSGTAIGGKRYFDAIAGEIADSIRPYNTETAAIFEGHLQSFGSIYPDPDDEEDTIDDQKQDEESDTDEGINRLLETAYIHLKNARFYYPGEQPIPANRGVFWRGQMSQVQGFIFGTLNLGD